MESNRDAKNSFDRVKGKWAKEKDSSFGWCKIYFRYIYINGIASQKNESSKIDEFVKQERDASLLNFITKLIYTNTCAYIYVSNNIINPKSNHYHLSIIPNMIQKNNLCAT